MRQKRGLSIEIGHSRGSSSTKIHAVVDSYGYPVYVMLSGGQRNNINYAVPVIGHVNINGSFVLADKGYGSNKFIDYIYENGGEPVIPSRKNAKFQRKYDKWIYIECYLVENFFNKIKAFRRIATRYDKFTCTYAGFLCIACICGQGC